MLEIIPFETQYAKDFYALNIEWLQTHFYVEPFDEEVLSKPEYYIISKGGYIFFIRKNNRIVGTVALMPTSHNLIFELTKMAILTSERGQKLGQKLLQHCIDFARSENFDALMLYSARKLENAIYIYRKFGFVELQLEADSPYARSDIKMELRLK